MMGRGKKREPIFPPIINKHRSQREVKKTDDGIQTPKKNEDKLCQRTQWSPQEPSIRRNPASNQ
jgi:hypothetical protein